MTDDDEQERWDKLCDSVHGDVANRLRDHDGSMLTKYVLLVEAIVDDGERALFSLTSNGTKPWESLGMLEFAKQVEQAASNHDEDDP